MTQRPAGFSRRCRLLRPADFSRVYDTRQSAAAGPLVLYAAVNRGDPAGVRLGLSVSRRIGSAVVRNRWKRRLREAFRTIRARLPAGNDFVIVVRSGTAPAGAAGARQIEAAVADLVTRVVRRRGYAAAEPQPRREPPSRDARR
ncbi:MAG: ribonuclease P protein component [Planctomycetaceae bacterium]